MSSPLDVIFLLFDPKVLLGAIGGIFLREMTVWLPAKKDRRLTHLEKLVNQVWGPMVPFASRINEAFEGTIKNGEIIVVADEVLPLQSVSTLMPYEFSRMDEELLENCVNRIHPLSGGGYYRVTPDSVTKEFAKRVVERWERYSAEIFVLREMRDSFFWRFWWRSPRGEQLMQRSEEIKKRGPILIETAYEEIYRDNDRHELNKEK